ncbi:MAG: S8 family peptidase [Gaiellaceae bacterium]
MPLPLRIIRFLAPVAIALAATFAPHAAASRGHSDQTKLVIGFRHGVTASDVRRLLGSVVRVKTIVHLRAAVLRAPSADARAAIERLRRAGLLAYAEPDRILVRVAQDPYVQAVPTDPLWPQQWGAAKLEGPAAWAVTNGSSKTIVAVLDTGVDFGQPDLQGAFVPGYDFVNGDSDPSDDQGHGTSVAGLVAARANNGIGVAGLCPQCSVMPVKVIGSDGTGLTSTVAEGMTWAVDHGARVINVSLGGTDSSDVLGRAVQYAQDHGVLVVAAAGNNGSSTPFYPAAYPGVLSVAGSDENDQLYSWSDSGSWVDVAAPGCDMATLRGGGFGNFCGTSASTPVVSGLAGLAFSFAPTATAAAVAHAIESTAVAESGVAFGRVDAALTLRALGAVLHTAQAAPVPVTAPAGPVAGHRTAPASHRRRRARRRRSTAARPIRSASSHSGSSRGWNRRQGRG